MGDEKMAKGSLEVIVGCMSSGKTEELVRLLRRAIIARQEVINFKPLRDDRNHGIESRNGFKLRAIAVCDPLEIPASVGSDCTVVGIDEAQFFDIRLVAAIDTLIDRGVRVIVAALDTDYNGRPFGIVPHLMAIADKVVKVCAICVQCGKDAVRTQILVKPKTDGDPILVGGNELYEARCRDCHRIP